MSSSFDPSMRCIVTPADRSFKRHQQEQAEIDEALTIGAVAKKGRVRLVARRKAK